MFTSESAFAQLDSAEELVRAAGNGDLSAVRSLLESGIEVDYQVGDNAATALVMASQNGHVEIVQALLAEGAEVDHQKNDGATALYVASQNGHVEIVQALLAEGAEIDVRDKDDWTALIMASQQGHEEVVETLLAAGTEIDAQGNDGGWTALVMASQNGHEEIVQALLTEGADVNLPVADGRTALIQASFQGHEEIVQALLSTGAEIDHQANNGITALFIASYSGHVGIVRVLLAAGANVHLRENGGETALSEAKTPQIKEMLTAGGATLVAESAATQEFEVLSATVTREDQVFNDGLRTTETGGLRQAFENRSPGEGESFLILEVRVTGETQLRRGEIGLIDASGAGPHLVHLWEGGVMIDAASLNTIDSHGSWVAFTSGARGIRGTRELDLLFIVPDEHIQGSSVRFRGNAHDTESRHFSRDP